MYADDLERSRNCGFGLEHEPEPLLAETARDCEEDMQGSAVDEGDATQVEQETGLVRRYERFETLLEFTRVGEVELTADADEDLMGVVRALGLEIVRCHSIRRHHLPGVVKSPNDRRLRPAPRGYRCSINVANDIRAEVPEDFRIDEMEHVRGTKTVVLAVHGDADMNVAEELEARLTEVIDEGPSAVVLDLSEVTFLDSTVLAVLLHGLKRMGAAGGRLRIVIARPEIRRIFELTLLDRLFELDSSREEALSATTSSS